MQYTSIVIIAIVLTIPAIQAGAQVASLETTMLRDDIPAAIQQTKLSLSHHLGGGLFSQSSYRYLFADQDPFNGLPRYRVPLHTIEQTVQMRLFEEGLSFEARGALTALPTKAIVGDYMLGASWALPLSVNPGEAPILFTLKAEAGRSRDLSVTTAMHENVSHREAAGQLDVSLMQVLDLSARAARYWYNDGNRKDAAYAYLLANLLNQPRIILGYAWSWTDTRLSNWRATGTSFDPRSRDYHFEYFYYPYFTPLMERGHHAIAVVQWFMLETVLLHAKATIPVYSRGRLKYMPESGRSPVPIDYDVTYEIEDILPTQYEAGIITDLFDPVTVSISGEYFSKPYYSYTAGRIALQYTFGKSAE